LHPVHAASLLAVPGVFAGVAVLGLAGVDIRK
jgi:hypothetical protein